MCSLKYKALVTWKNLADAATHLEILLYKPLSRFLKNITEWFKCYCYFLSSQTETYNDLFCYTDVSTADSISRPTSSTSDIAFASGQKLRLF